MTGQSFSLRPFAANPLLAVEISGAIARRGQTLTIAYDLRGPLAALALPSPAVLPARRHRLWEETCFEFFLAPQGAPRYWEFNLSPAGHWNVYRFAAYRQEMAEEQAFASLPFHVRTRPDFLRLALEGDLGTIVPANQALEVAIATVLRLKDGAVT